jgi:thymidylate synthase (FAD)
MPVNEVSRRYVSDSPEFYLPKHEWRQAAENVKQGSSEEFIDEDTSCYVQADVEAHMRQSLELYQLMLKVGVCAEQSRMILPQAMMTIWYWSGTLSAFADMLKLRLDGHAQKEIQYMAQKIRDIIEPLFPVSLTALLGNT